MRTRRIVVLLTGAFFALGAVAFAAAKFNNVKPTEFDPAKTHLVHASWQDGIGCPTNAGTSSDGVNQDGTYSDPACTTGDAQDKQNEGLILAKTGPSANFASAFVELKDVKGITLNELGYDIRKAGPTVNDDRGSHCDNGSPRFIIVTTTTTAAIGCRSPQPDTTTAGNGFLRLRWTTGLPSGTVQQIFILSDDGTDTGPDNFGLSVLDNIDVNGTLVGHGSH